MKTTDTPYYSAIHNNWAKAFDRLKALDTHKARCIADFCENHNPDPELLSWIFESVQYDNIEDQNKPELSLIIGSLQENHRYYRNTALPQIGQTFSHLITDDEPKFTLRLCETLFDLYATSLIEHIDEEERLFKNIRQHSANFQSSSNMDDHHHNDETEALDQIISLAASCAQPKSFDPCNILLVRLKNLSNDLKIHTFIEEQLLFPLLKSNTSQNI